MAQRVLYQRGPANPNKVKIYVPLSKKYTWDILNMVLKDLTKIWRHQDLVFQFSTYGGENWILIDTSYNYAKNNPDAMMAVAIDIYTLTNRYNLEYG